MEQIKQKGIKTEYYTRLHQIKYKEKKAFPILGLFFTFTFISLLLYIESLNSKKDYKKNFYLKRYNVDKNMNKSEICMNYLGTNYSVITYTESKQKKYDKNEIEVSYSLDNKLVYPTFISMLSGLENCDPKNILVYHLLFSNDFNISNIRIFESLKDKYDVKIIYYIIPNIFGKFPRWTDGTDCVYYKIILPILFPNKKRMIYIDGDTLIRKDIYEMYSYPFNNNYLLGYPFFTGYIMEKYGIKNPPHYVNGGCLLFNIEKINADNKAQLLLNITKQNMSSWYFREQDSLNYALFPNIGFLPLKYGIYMIGSNKTFENLAKYTHSPLNLTEGYEAIMDPSLVHFSCCWPKVWSKGPKNLFRNHELCYRYQNEFYNYAKKSLFYYEIYNTLYLKSK